MIKLKIGDNYLLTTHKDPLVSTFITYMMGCYHDHNQLVFGFDLTGHPNKSYDDYIKAIKDEHPTTLYILYSYTSRIYSKLQLNLISNVMHDFIMTLKEQIPMLNIKVIQINNAINSREYKIAREIYDTLVMDKKSILSHLKELDEYKAFAARYKSIPAELKVINNNIKNMSKINKVSDRIVTLKDLEPLNLIDDAELEGDLLILTLKPVPIYPSEPLGKSFILNDFKYNPYLRTATKYIYQGCHFGMVGTRILIHPTFTPEFIETRDHRFDDMFAHNNWSNIGYLHFGKGHLCGGEFNDVIARAAEHGLDYYFMCFKQYITTANMRDYAGKKVWWYPIYNDKEELVYCAGLAIMRDYLLENCKDLLDDNIADMNWTEFSEWLYAHRKNFNFGNICTDYRSDNVHSYSGSNDNFLEYCKTDDIDLYNELMKGAK